MIVMHRYLCLHRVVSGLQRHTCVVSSLWCRDGSVLTVFFMNAFRYLWGHCRSPTDPLPADPLPVPAGQCCRQGHAQHLSLFLCWQTGSWRPPVRAGLIFLDKSKVFHPHPLLLHSLGFFIHSDISWHAWWASSIQSVRPYFPTALLRPQRGWHHFHRGHSGFQGLLAVSWVGFCIHQLQTLVAACPAKSFAAEPWLLEPACPLIPFCSSCWVWGNIFFERGGLPLS